MDLQNKKKCLVEEGYIYLFRLDDWMKTIYKIGKSKNVRTRGLALAVEIGAVPTLVAIGLSDSPSLIGKIAPAPGDICTFGDCPECKSLPAWEREGHYCASKSPLTYQLCELNRYEHRCPRGFP